MNGQALRTSIDKVIRDWESQVQAHHSPAADEFHPALQKQIPSFLNSVATALENSTPQPYLAEPQSTAEAESLSEILEEYSILRKTLKSFLQQSNADSKSQNLVDELIDQAMIHATQTQARPKLQSNQRELEQFAAIAAHDLRSPVATMSGYINLLKEEISNPNQMVAQSLEFISAASDRMLTLIERLLDYSRIGKDDTRKSQVDLNQCLVHTQENLESMLANSKAQIFYDSLPAVFGDEALLGQLLQNLISNSVKFRGSHSPLIEIKCLEETETEWLFSVKDNGIGFENHQAASIFEPFKRLHSKKEYQGSGLGLATCRRVTELHGGRIWCEGHPGQGSTFYFTLAKPAF